MSYRFSQHGCSTPGLVSRRSTAGRRAPDWLRRGRPSCWTAPGAGPVSAGSTLALDVAGRGGVPADADAVVLNVTATAGQIGGFVTVYPCDATRPLASSLNFGSSAAVANTVTTELSADGKVCLF